MCIRDRLYPKMSDEDWDNAAKGQPFAGILPIGSQGCTLMTGLMLRGPYSGQVVYFDLDCCSKPFFVRENGFLAWYMRCLLYTSSEQTGHLLLRAVRSS